ncbi:hypothetical protein HDV00_010832 [Rhizophlyctis rosea]|nr:hypothetical protein HDV00_010832 [Rhizophlyctis rosea]
MSSAVNNAAIKHNVAVVYILLAAGALIRFMEGGLALIDAVRAGHLQLAGRLLCRAIDVNLEDKREGRRLVDLRPATGLDRDGDQHCGSEGFHSGGSSVDLEEGADWVWGRRSSVNQSVVAEHMPVVKSLLNDHDIDVNAENGRPLTMAAVLGLGWLVEVLWKRVRTCTCGTISHKYAMEKGQTEIVKVCRDPRCLMRRRLMRLWRLQKDFEVRELFGRGEEGVQGVWNGVDKVAKGKFVVG